MRASKDHTAKDKLYRKFKGGDMTSLADLLEGERAGLYDFLVRMTGQISRSMDTIDEVFQSLNEDTLDTIETYAELKVCLYTTARKFNADIWNAETTRLMNPVLEGPPSAEFGSPAALKERQVRAAVDRQLRGLAGREREMVILSAMIGYDAAEAGEVMGLGEHEVAPLLEGGLRRFAGEGGLSESAVIKVLTDLPLHSAPPRSSQATVNLSMVMQGIKTRPAGLWSLSRLVLTGVFLLIVAVAAVRFTNPDAFQRVVRWFGESSGPRPAPKSESRMPPPIDNAPPRPAP